jgi:hypothetical protein
MASLLTRQYTAVLERESQTYDHEVHGRTGPPLGPVGVDLDDGLVQGHPKEAGAEEDGDQANQFQAPHNWGTHTTRRSRTVNTQIMEGCRAA